MRFARIQLSSFDAESNNASANKSLMTNLFCLGVETETASGNGDDVDKPSEEIANYLKEKTLGKSSQMQAWWNENRKNYPLVYNLRLKYLCIPATLASSECSFSTSGLTVTTLRSRLTGSHVGALNLLHCNKALLDTL